MARCKKIAQFVGSKGTVKVYRDAEWNEYIAKLGAASYHTPDKADAIATAQVMAGFDPIRAIERSAEAAMENADTRGIECTHGVHLSDSCADCRRTVARDVKAGDAIGGKLVTRIVQGFMSAPTDRIGFYLESGERVEFEPHEVVPGHAAQLTLPVITPQRRRELDAAIERGEDRKSCECESNVCDAGGRHRPGDRCPRPANPKMVTTYGTVLCTKCGEAMPKRFMKSHS